MLLWTQVAVAAQCNFGWTSVDVRFTDGETVAAEHAASAALAFREPEPFTAAGKLTMSVTAKALEAAKPEALEVVYIAGVVTEADLGNVRVLGRVKGPDTFPRPMSHGTAVWGSEWSVIVPAPLPEPFVFALVHHGHRSRCLLRLDGKLRHLPKRGKVEVEE